MRKAIEKRRPARRPRAATKPAAKGRSKPRAAKQRAVAAGAPDGDAAVRRYIAALPLWQRAIAARFDQLVARRIQRVRRVIKWGLPFYGVAGHGWFVSCGGFAKAVKITFFQGASLRPTPPSGGGPQIRCIDLGGADDFDDALIGSWIVQAAALPGFGS